MNDFQKELDKKLEKAIIENDNSDVLVSDYDILKEVRESIAEIRKKENVSQKELAEKTGITQANISKIENGRYIPSVIVLKRIADGLGKRLYIEFSDELEEE